MLKKTNWRIFSLWSGWHNALCPWLCCFVFTCLSATLCWAQGAIGDRILGTWKSSIPMHMREENVDIQMRTDLTFTYKADYMMSYHVDWYAEVESKDDALRNRLVVKYSMESDQNTWQFKDDPKTITQKLKIVPTTRLERSFDHEPSSESEVHLWERIEMELVEGLQEMVKGFDKKATVWLPKGSSTMVMSGTRFKREFEVSDSVYRAAVRELIAVNWKQGSKDCAALVGLKPSNIIVPGHENANSKKRYLVYYDEQFLDDQTDLFFEFCKEKFSLADVRSMTADMPVISKWLLLTRNPKVLGLFQNAAISHLNGSFQGFEQPDVTDSYKALCEQLYTLTNMQAIFDESCKVHPQYKSNPQELEAFYKANAPKFFLIVCQKNVTEAELKACVDMCAQQPHLYQKLIDHSAAHEEEITRIAKSFFYVWVSDLELNMTLGKAME